MMPQTARAAKNWRRENAARELRVFEHEVAATYRSVRRTMGYALACTGCDGEQKTVDNYLADMFSDVFARERTKLRAELEEAGGEVPA